MTSTKPLKSLLLLSSSKCHGFLPLEFAQYEIEQFFKGGNVSEITFVPYALQDYDSYTKKIREIFNQWGFRVNGIHEFKNPKSAINVSKGIFVGGGNTFLLLKTLYDLDLVDLIREKVFSGQLLYMGASAGTNVATKSIHTTNDMPIIYPPTFEALGLVPFNINPHYIDHAEVPNHKGETRDERILEFLGMPNANSVLGLKEGSYLLVVDDKIYLKGVSEAVLFNKNKEKKAFKDGSDLSFLNAIE